MRFNGLLNAMAGNDDYKIAIENIRARKLPCQIHGLSESQKAFISYCFFEEVKNQTLILTYNDIEAKKIYDDIKSFTDKCYYFPVSETIFNIDTTSGGIKTRRLEVIKRLLSGEKIVVVASIDSVFAKLVPKERLVKSFIKIALDTSMEILDLSAKLIDYGYERVDIVEGRGQFALRGGIIDIFPPDSEKPYRIEFFGDDVDTIRSFDVITQRSLENIDSIFIYPARELILNSEDINNASIKIKNEFDVTYKRHSKKNRDAAQKLKERVFERIEKLKNFRNFEGIDSYITYLYERTDNFIDYFKNPFIILDETSRIIQRVKSYRSEFDETFKNLLEKGEVLPGQGEYVFDQEWIFSMLQTKSSAVLNMLPRIIDEVRAGSIANFKAITVNPMTGNLDYMLEEIRSRVNMNYSVVILTGNEARGMRLAKSLRDEGFNSIYDDDLEIVKKGLITVSRGSLGSGMEFPDIKLSIISEGDIIKDKKERKRNVVKKGAKIQSFTDIKSGDYVVHVNHGIGVFKGIKELLVQGIKKDYLVLQYHGGDTLYVPVEQLDMVQKYIGADEGQPKLYKLGGTDWAKTKNKVKESLKEMAEELVALYAARNAISGHGFSKDTPWQKQFEDEFPYEETPDQLTAIEEIKKDMENPRPMDRLLCGDVGYGKTEVAMRAAFKAVMDGKQVAVLVPTTILAEQHNNNFTQRFKDFPVRIDMVSRFRSREQQKKTLKDLTAGNVDVIIGTHRLLQKDIKYKDLGLLIVDEEQRFGVSHKEKIKAIKKNIDVLTLTATPIPRTLHMSMIGVRDMSIIETPPEERYPVQTYVMEYNEGIIREAIVREISRGGQVFFVYNRVETITDMQAALGKLVPEAKVVIAHGQMNEGGLEDVIVDFVNGVGDVLLCTTIIETGIDMPNVNTLIVYDADRMGLSQLYQLRGRVGRSTRLAYSYFTYRKDKILTEVAEKRLKAIKEFTEFGSGFKIAMRDLEIRGAGNLLGRQQHGHMASVGYDLYCKMLEEAVHELKGEELNKFTETTIELTINAYIPDDYITDEVLKIEIYKKIASIEGLDDKMDIEDEIIDRFGDLKDPIKNLIDIAYIKATAKNCTIKSIKQVGKDVLIHFNNRDYLQLDFLRELNAKLGNRVSYGSNTQPILKLKLKNTSTAEIIGTLKEFIETVINLHTKVK